MSKLIYVLLVAIFFPFLLHGQVKPADGDTLNYRLVGFALPKQKNAKHYTIQIASGWHTSEDSFQHNVFLTLSEDTNKIIGQVPAFGKAYTWRYLALGKDAHMKSDLYHFRTIKNKWVNEDSVRLRILAPATAHKDDYIFLDGNRTLYDMEGNAVWTVGNLRDGKKDEHPRDIKLSSVGTLTLMLADQIYELDYDNNVLWMGPGKGQVTKKMDSVAHLHHHEFTRLSNGHFMTLGFEHMWWRVAKKIDTAMFRKIKKRFKRDSANNIYERITFATILEYDRSGKVVWRWSSGEYIKNSDLNSRRLPIGTVDLQDTHANAVYFDEQRKIMVLSFRNLNRVVKIEYPSGKVINTYGKLYLTPGKRNTLANKWFCGQHGVRIAHDGSIYMFNNNVCHAPKGATILMFKDVPAKKDSIEVLWEYECPMDELGPEERKHIVFNMGGNVIELPDRSFFCNMGSEYGKVFIVTRDKKIVWSAQPEVWKKNKWSRIPEYRACVVTRKELERFIWSAPSRD